MKSDIFHIDNRGVGFDSALAQVDKVAQFRDLGEKEALRLRICAEEMLGLARSVTGEMEADFWLESEGKRFDLHMGTKTVMDKEKRRQLLSAASSRKNEAAKSFLGRLRDAFEEALLSEPDYSAGELPDEVAKDICYYHPEDPDWDGYEQSILSKLADEIKISIRGRTVDMTVTKSFE